MVVKSRTLSVNVQSGGGAGLTITTAGVISYNADGSYNLEATCTVIGLTPIKFTALWADGVVQSATENVLPTHMFIRKFLAPQTPPSYVDISATDASGRSGSARLSVFTPIGPPPPPTGVTVSVTASDPSDLAFSRDAYVFVDSPPGSYLGGGKYSNSNPFASSLVSPFGSTFNVDLTSLLGAAHILYFIVTQSGGSSYGTYSGTFGGVPFSGVDVNDYATFQMSSSGAIS